MNSDGRWLLIFDNADDLTLLLQVWPGGAHGSILITSRDFNAAHQSADQGFHVQPFDDTTASQILLRLAGLDPDRPINQKTAKTIAHTLGGLPLALSQIASFISQRKLPLQDFIPLYERNAATIDDRKSRLTSYEHSLSTMWEISLAKLSGASGHLQKLLAFLEPDEIDEAMVIEGSQSIIDEDFIFLRDEMG